jgi:hypothetical protein
MQDRPRWPIFFVTVALLVVLTVINLQKIYWSESMSWIFVGECLAAYDQTFYIQASDARRHALCIGEYEIVRLPFVKDLWLLSPDFNS